MRLVTLVGLAAFLAAAAEAGQAGRGMEGGCEAYAWDMRREMAAWDQGGTTLAALAAGSPEAAAVPLGRRLDVKLLPVGDVRFAAAPERKPEAGYAGLVPVSVPADGTYRVSAGSRVWLDVVAQGQRIPSAKFEGHGGCAKVHKSVAFALKAGTRYLVQVSASEKAEVSLMVTPEP